MKLFWGNFYRHLANFFWSHWSRCNLQQYSLISGSGVAQLAERSLPVRIQSLANFNKPVGCFNSDGTNIAGILSLCQKKKVLYILYLKEFITYFGQFLGYWDILIVVKCQNGTNLMAIWSHCARPLQNILKWNSALTFVQNTTDIYEAIILSFSLFLRRVHHFSYQLRYV